MTLTSNGFLATDITPQIDINAPGIDLQDLQKEIGDQPQSQKPLMLWVRKSVLTVSKTVNKKYLEILVKDNPEFAKQVIEQPLLQLGEKEKDDPKVVNLKPLSISKKIILHPAHQAINEHDTKTINTIKNFSVPPYYRRGLYLVALSEVFEVQQYIETRLKERDDLINEFLYKYDDIIKEMTGVLTHLFDFKDYPDKDKVRSKYTFVWKFFSFDTPLSLKDVSISLYNKEKERSEQYWDKVREEVKGALVQSYRKLVGHLVNQLSPSENEETTKKRFNSKSVQNIINYIDKFTTKNAIASDTELAELIDQSKQLLAGVDIKTIKKNANVGSSILEGFTDIQNKLDTLTETRTGRSFELFDTDDSELESEVESSES